MSSKTRMWRQVQRRDSAHAGLRICGLRPRTFSESSEPKALLLGPLQGLAIEAFLACPAGLRPLLHPGYRLVPQRASPLKLKS